MYKTFNPSMNGMNVKEKRQLNDAASMCVPAVLRRLPPGLRLTLQLNVASNHSIHSKSALWEDPKQLQIHG
jgi:hypothetical protein